MDCEFAAIVLVLTSFVASRRTLNRLYIYIYIRERAGCAESCVLIGPSYPSKETESIKENENEENKNVDEFQEYILQQKPTDTKEKHKAA